MSMLLCYLFSAVLFGAIMPTASNKAIGTEGDEWVSLLTTVHATTLRRSSEVAYSRLQSDAEEGLGTYHYLAGGPTEVNEAPIARVLVGIVIILLLCICMCCFRLFRTDPYDSMFRARANSADAQKEKAAEDASTVATDADKNIVTEEPAAEEAKAAAEVAEDCGKVEGVSEDSKAIEEAKDESKAESK
eukprot:gnl/TRDRNA2_/TRDRNA2_39175_c0_seq2.p2 gnl/TRDRNA2_/TRDRNA2_39175_c0~~gnl/TRDRNA2_/TRDRNA2_39175_c0_seq2.p2  ORF type:complete len:189 (+),score=42.31 gnl/TRDRNA2_/TRDRNA2_39175_c0_seq2:114-680(+)